MRTLHGYIPLTRRLLGQYLMFALASVAALGAGLLVLHLTAPSRHHDAHVLELLDQTAESVAHDMLERDGRNVQLLVDRAVITGELHFCAVADENRAYVAHSSREMIGQPSEFVAVAKRDFVVERVHLSRGESGQLMEYSRPLIVQGRPKGFVHLGHVHLPPEPWSHALLEYAPPAMLVPFLCLVIGSKVITGSVRTNSVVEERLAEASSLPAEAAVSLLPMDADGPVADGWNRLTQHLRATRTDTSLEKRLESALGGLREKRAEAALQAIPEGIGLTDAEDRIAYGNASLYALIGLHVDDAREKPLLELMPWHGTADAAAIDEQFEEPMRPVIIEYLRGDVVADGVLRVARYSHETSEGHPAGHVWHIRDITQQKLAEEAREQFVYAATHELRTPLANIRAYAETLSVAEFDDEEQRKGFLNTINTEATRLGRFVDDLLNISQMEAGSMTLHPQKTEVRRMLVEVVDKVRPQMDQKAITLDVAMPAKLPELTIDKENITAAIVNVLGNAAKYTPHGGKVTLRVDCDESILQVHVEDTGIGIAADELPKLGRKFFRSSDERVRDETGTGLGLAFTQEVVRLHGGRLTIASEINKGSRFTISLPTQ